MDINRVELKGMVATDVAERKNKRGEMFLTFAVGVRERQPTTAATMPKYFYNYVNVGVFSAGLVKKLLKVGIHRGVQVWIVGKLFSKIGEKRGVKVPYTNVIATEAEVLRARMVNGKIVIDETDYGEGAGTVEEPNPLPSSFDINDVDF